MAACGKLPFKQKSLPHRFGPQPQRATLDGMKSFAKLHKLLLFQYSKSRIQLQERPDVTRGGGPVGSFSTLNIPEVPEAQRS
jgi:hypothetical protein